MLSFFTYTAISIKVVPEQSRKGEYERERMLGIANKFINFLAIPSSLSHLYSTFLLFSTFPLYSWTTLIEIAVYATIVSVFKTDYKANNTAILKTNLPSSMSATLLRSFTRFLALKKVLKFAKSWKNTIYLLTLQEMFVISLSSFVIQQQILNLKNQCSLFMTIRHIF